MMTLIERGAVRPEQLVERTVGLEGAAAMLPGLDRAAVAGVTVIDPAL